MNAISPHKPPDAAPDRRTRQLDFCRHAAEKALRAIDIASEQLETAHASGEPGATASPTLDLTRAIRGLVLAINAENRVADGQSRRRAPASDPRRPLLREALHKAADAEPNPKRRAALHHELDERIEDTLLTDPDAEIDLSDHLCTLADEFHLFIDVTKLSDAVLGIQPYIYAPPGTQPGPHHRIELPREWPPADTGDS